MKLLKLLAAGSLLLGGAVNAQDAATPEQEVRRYTVEVIIFSYAEDVGVGTEIFVPEPGEFEGVLPADDEGIVFDDTNMNAPEVEEPLLRELEISLLGRDELTLTDVRRKLDRLDVYQPLMHFGWTQPTYPPEETPAIQLHAFGRPPQPLSGELKLYLSRFLHLVVDLSLDAGNDVERVLYRIDEDRIVKNGDTRYFDHPRFGVIAKVTRVEEETADEPVA